MAEKNHPLGNFENKSRLLSSDERELVKVLLSFYDAIEELRDRVGLLENGKTTINIEQHHE
jgi:hypothetical protein